jgi:hypothetical protein
MRTKVAFRKYTGTNARHVSVQDGSQQIGR